LNLGKTLEARTIYDHDAHLSKNYGFIGKTPILLTVAPRKNPSSANFKAGSLPVASQVARTLSLV
jgi:hypothetical protein